jgi:hypothetical protein
MPSPLDSAGPPRLGRRTVLRAGLAAGAGLIPALRGVSSAAAAPVAPSAAATAPVKTRSTYYTPERVASARRNIDEFAWAQHIRDSVMGAADRMAAQADDWLWSLPPGQTLPRSINVNYELGSPVTGRDVYQLGFYPFTYDPWNQPWKIIDPLAQQRGLPYVFPSNDFGSFYRSALDEHGVFDPSRGDPAFLVNELYPEQGPDWLVDNGLGWFDDDGNRWTPIAYYCHYAIWYGSGSQIGPGLQSLRDAYLYTGDVKYAHAGIIVLDRIADLYPSMSTGAYPYPDFRNNDPYTNKGKILGSIWETGYARDLVAAYDAFFPALADGDPADVVPLLSAKAQQYGLPPKDSVEAIRLNIENGLLRQIYPSVKSAQIYGNFGSHQSTLAMAGVVLDYPDETAEWFDFLFAAGEIVPDPEYHVTGGNVYPTLVDTIDRDGWGAESSPFYSNTWFDNLKVVADVLDGYEGYPGVDLYGNPKFRKMFTAGPRIVGLDKFLPSIGDSGACGQPGIGLTKPNYVKGYEEYDESIDAQLAYLLNKNQSSGLNTGIFSDDPAATEQGIQGVIDADGPLDLPSDNLTGYGLAFLRDGSVAGGRREAWVYYGRSNAAHSNLDTLNLGLYAFGLDLLPDHGYPEATDYSNFTVEFTHNTVAHNTVIVDATPQTGAWVGEPHGFAGGSRVQFADIAAPKAYSQASTYRRATAMVTVDDENSYLIDVFRIVGGSDHVFSFHAAEGPVSTDNLTLADQPTGTYAGPDVPIGVRLATPTDRTSPGYNWLDQVARDEAPQAPFSLDWAVVDTWDADNPDPQAHLRLSVLSDVDDVALADGQPPQNNPRNPRRLRYALLHRKARGEAPLASQFVTVVEPYRSDPLVAEATLAPVRVVGGAVQSHEVTAVKVRLANGRVDYVVSSMRPDVTLVVDGAFTFQGSFGVCSVRGRQVEHVFSHGSLVRAPGAGRSDGPIEVTGRLDDYTRDLVADNTLLVTPDDAVPDPGSLVGEYVYVENDGERNAAYRIVGAGADQRGRLTIDIGNATTVRGYVDDTDFSQGFRYDVATGARVRIPLTREWTR